MNESLAAMEPFQIRDESLEDVDVDGPWNAYEDTSRLLASNDECV